MKLNFTTHAFYLIGFFLFFNLLSSCSIKTEKREKKPNVIFFLVDDLGWTDLECYGSKFYETPSINALAETGVRFTNAYSACHVCSPTRASILTGKYPATLNLTDWLPGRNEFPFQKFSNAKINQHLPYDEVTIAKALKEDGYKTAIIGKWHLGEDPSNPMAHGFDMHIPDWAKGWPKDGYFAPFGMKGLEDSKDRDYLTDRLTDEALNYIETNRANPFFLYMSHYAVHDPIQGRKDLVEKYSRKLKNMEKNSSPEYILEGNPDNPDNPSREELDKLLNTIDYEPYKILPNDIVKIKQKQDNIEFAGMVESMDESLGGSQKKLKELSLEENTIIIFYSDNGGMSAANFGRPDRNIAKNSLDKAFATSNLPLRGGKGWMYEGGIRVPLIIKWPGKGLQGAVSNIPVTSPDFFPTILEMLGIQTDNKAKDRTDGKSIVTLLKGKKTLDRDAIFWHFPHYSNHGNQSPGGAVRSGDYKLIEYYENGSVQLFNLVNDLSEQNDLSLKEPEKVKELKTMLHKWRSKVDAKMMLPNPDYDANTKIHEFK
ncbi:MAG: sulfatase [Saprospiraceae bacterium]|nr:sulfatase [Saprospiraceae bacterium]